VELFGRLQMLGFVLPPATLHGRFWRGAYLSVGAPLGNLEGGLYTGDFERRMKEGSWRGASLSEGAS
jgi:hypothetical protein